MTTFIDVHAIQTIGPANLNRDDAGAPKSVMIGGTRRARVSSQAWKRAIRNQFAQSWPKNLVGVRTRLVTDTVTSRVEELDPSIDNARDHVVKALTALKFISSGKNADAEKSEDEKESKQGQLSHLSRPQLDALAEYIVHTVHEGEKPKKDDMERILVLGPSIDMALFGRMMASTPKLNIDAACQVAHAVGVSALTSEFDYFTAMDDLASEGTQGAAMVGSHEFTSSTLYRYATVAVEDLQKNLKDVADVADVVTAFVDGFITALPSGKQNSFAANTLPELVVVSIRHDRPVSLVGAYESAISSQTGVVSAAVERLVETLSDYNAAYGDGEGVTFYLAVGKLSDTASSIDGTAVTLPELRDAVRAAVAEV